MYISNVYLHESNKYLHFNNTFKVKTKSILHTEVCNM